MTIRLPVRRNALIRETGLSDSASSEMNPLEEDFEEAHLDESGKPLVLIIEDNRDVARYIASCIDPYYRVVQAENGQTGLSKCIELIPDIVITDIMMPEMDGLALTQSIKKDIRTNHIPLLILTAKSSKEDRLDGLQLGADAFITKPFDEQELLSKLKNFIQLRDAIHQSINTPEADKKEMEKNPFLVQVDIIIEKNFENSHFTIAQLCRDIGLSRMQLHRKLKALTNLTTATYIREFRFRKAKRLLSGANLNVSEVAYQCGFSDPSQFSRSFSQRFGESPSDYKKNIARSGK